MTFTFPQTHSQYWNSCPGPRAGVATRLCNFIRLPQTEQVTFCCESSSRAFMGLFRPRQDNKPFSAATRSYACRSPTEERPAKRRVDGRVGAIELASPWTERTA